MVQSDAIERFYRRLKCHTPAASMHAVNKAGRIGGRCNKIMFDTLNQHMRNQACIELAIFCL